MPKRLLTCYRGLAMQVEVDEAEVARFAAVEVMRRLIGVAQLPIPPSGVGVGVGVGMMAHFRTALLERSRVALCSGEWERLWPTSGGGHYAD